MSVDATVTEPDQRVKEVDRLPMFAVVVQPPGPLRDTENDDVQKLAHVTLTFGLSDAACRRPPRVESLDWLSWIV
jgi:hypothetical protein